MTKYSYPMFERLEPRTDWRGGPLYDADVVTLDEAAAFASKHAGAKVTPADFLRAAGRGQIELAAIVHRTTKVHSLNGGILYNAGKPDENTVPAGAIPTLPLTACQHLAAINRASWRTFDGFEIVDGVLCRFTKGELDEGEPDFETVPDDCRVTGWAVHALADLHAVETPEPAAPVLAKGESKAQREDRRLKACIDAGLAMNEGAALLRLPDGVGDVADREGVTRQAFSTDVKAALKRRESAKREGQIIRRP